MLVTLHLYDHMTNLPLCSFGNLGSQPHDPTIIDPHGIGTHLCGTYDLTINSCLTLRKTFLWLTIS